MEDIEYVYIEILGSDYESKWNLLAGKYKFSVPRIKKSLVFDSPQNVVTIDRSFIKHYGIKVRDRQNVYFFSIGSRSPLGKGEILIRAQSMNIDSFNQWVRSKMSKSRSSESSAMFLRNTLLRPPQSRSIKSRSEPVLPRPVSKLSQFLKAIKGTTFRKNRPEKKSLIQPKEEYSEVDDEEVASGYTYEECPEDVSDTETEGLVLPPSFPESSSTGKAEIQSGSKWHEKDSIYTEYVSEYLIPVEQENEKEVIVTKSGHIYALPSVNRAKKQWKKRPTSNIVDYYNTSQIYYNSPKEIMEAIEEGDSGQKNGV